MRVSKLLLMAQFLPKCGLFLQKARLADFKARREREGRAEVIGHFKDVHRSRGRCREHLKATPHGTLLSNLHNLIVPICWRHSRMLKDVHWCSDPILMLHIAWHWLKRHSPNVIRPKVLNPIPSLSLRLGTFQFWSLIPAHPECGHFIFWTRKEDCHRGCLQSIQGPRKRNPFSGWTFSFRCFQFDFLSS